jgi:tRNA pseudouridine32 synthase/23S rRNA pseudouridine746 synthase
MATSGVMVIANGTQSLRVLGRQFETRTTSKIYIARVWGHVQGDDGLIDEPLICDYPNRPLQKICYEHGKPSQTHWRVLDRFDDTTILELKPVTGRSHQLRVHCQFMGHPIVGDNFYARGDALTASERLELYAYELSINHPVTDERMTFIAPCAYVQA